MILMEKRNLRQDSSLRENLKEVIDTEIMPKKYSRNSTLNKMHLPKFLIKMEENLKDPCSDTPSEISATKNPELFKMSS